jgi:hypothetical protein
MRILCLILLAVLTVPLFAAAIAYPRMSSAEWQVLTGYVPNSATDVTTSDSYVGRLHLSNKTAGALTCTLLDKSTNCGGAACHPWEAITIAANSVYAADLGGLYFPGGIQWSCSAASSVIGWMRGTYPQ